MRKLYGLWAGAMLAVLVLLGGVSPVRSQNYPLIRYYPTLSLRNFNVPPHDGVQYVPVAGGNGDRYFLVPVWIWNQVDTTFNNWDNSDGTRFGQHLEPVRSFNFELFYRNEMMELDVDHGSPIVMTGPSIVGNNTGSPVTARPDTGLAKTFFVTYTDQSSNNPLNQYEHVIRIAGASSVPLPQNASADTGYTEHNGILLWLRFKLVPGSSLPGDQLWLDSAKFNDHPGDSLIVGRLPIPSLNLSRLWTEGNFGGGTAPNGDANTGFLNVTRTDEPTFELRPLNLIALLNGADGPNDSLMPDMIYDPTVAGGQVTTQLQLDDASPFTEFNNITITSDQTWLTVGINQAGTKNSVFLGQDGIDYTTSYGSTVENFFLSVPNPSALAPGVYYATVTFTSDGASNSPFKLKVRFVRLASPDEPNIGGTGIRLNITNSCAPVQTNILTFGTGAGATDGIDVLYGEQIVTQGDVASAAANDSEMSYFVPLDLNADTAFQDPTFAGLTRDIRSDKTDTTLIYQVNFNPGNVNCYPVKVCVDPRDFPQGARIVMKFTLNGSEQGIDLRNATVDQNGMECVTISDRRINHFYIEYTPVATNVAGNMARVLKTYSWSLISLPVIPPNPTPSIIFPNSVGQEAWTYSSATAWTSAQQLVFGQGYMVRYGEYIGNDSTVQGIKSYSVTGVPIDQGWNSVGGTSGPGRSDGGAVFANGIPTQLVFTPTAPGQPVPQLETLNASTLWEFTPQTGYDQTVFYTPGEGYFIKVSDAGFYNLTTPTPPPGGEAFQNYTPAGKTAERENLQGQLTKVFVRDAEQNGQNLYFGPATTTIPESKFEMPGNFRSFDARFDANSGMFSYNHSTYTVDLHASSYPLTMTFTNLAGSVTVTDMNGTVLGTATNNGIVTIANPTVTKVQIAEKQDGIGQNVLGYSLEASSPNPFPQSTSIHYTLPQESVVSLVVYNALGQVVETLVSGTVGAGDHEVMFDGTNLPSGTYYYTLKAGNFVQTQSMSLQR